MEDDVPARGGAPEVPGYDVGRCLGRGSSADVWLVTERATRREFALKCFGSRSGAGGAADGGAEAAMRRELRVLAALDHSHLVRAHAVVRLRSPHDAGGDGLGLLLDYAPGGSLGGLLAGRGRLGPGETVTVLTPVAQALAYLHGHGFAHGDVSPGNVLFSAHGKPLLADLGVARMVADTGYVAEAGTEGFRDPAPVDAVRAGVQPERDVYSLAALGWYCLTGSAPGPEAQRPPLPLLVAGVPAALAEALEAGLAPDRRQRPGAAEFAAAVFRSTKAEPLDLSVSVHPTVIPRLLTRRALPRTAGQRRTGLPQGFRRWSAAARHAAAGEVRPDGPVRPPPPRRGTGQRRRGIMQAVSAALVLALPVLAWLLAGGHLPAFPSAADGMEPSAPAAVPPPPPRTDAAASGVAVPVDLQALLASADPVEAVRGLARLRSLALSSGDFGLLEQVNVPASSAAAADSLISARLTETGHVLAGFSTVLTRVERPAESSPSRAVVGIGAATTPYREQDAAGAVVAEAAAGAEQRLRLVLVPVEGRWRIQEILPGTSVGG
jgi:hypothetical protein